LDDRKNNQLNVINCDSEAGIRLASFFFYYFRYNHEPQNGQGIYDEVEELQDELDGKQKLLIYKLH